MKKEKHHVAWADRLGLNKRWEEAIKGCYYSWNQPNFHNHIEVLEHLLVDIKDGGPQLYTDTQEYKKEIIEPQLTILKQQWIEENYELSENQSFLQQLDRELKTQGDKLLFHHIIQLLEDNGFGFYKGSFDGEFDVMQ